MNLCSPDGRNHFDLVRANLLISAVAESDDGHGDRAHGFDRLRNSEKRSARLENANDRPVMTRSIVRADRSMADKASRKAVAPTFTTLAAGKRAVDRQRVDDVLQEPQDRVLQAFHVHERQRGIPEHVGIRMPQKIGTTMSSTKISTQTCADPRAGRPSAATGCPWSRPGRPRSRGR